MAGNKADAWSSSSRGHRAVPHTADIRLEAWAPTREECITEAALALVESFVDISHARPDREVTVSVPQGPPEDVLLAVLDEVIYWLDVHGEVPVDVEAATTDGGLEVRFAMTGTDAVEPIGAAPKAVTMHGLRFTADGVRWSCSVTVDV